MSKRSLSADQVFAAAERIVDDHGVDGLTIAALAAALGVRGPSLYSHVSGLDEVKAAVQARTMAQLSDVLRDAAMGRAAGDAMRAQCHAWRAYALANVNRYLAMTQSPGDPEIFLEASAGADVATRASLRAFDFSADEEAAAQFGLFATVHGFVSLELTEVFTTQFRPGTIDAVFAETVDRVVGSFEQAAAGRDVRA